jgi:hypothetical protein
MCLLSQDSLVAAILFISGASDQLKLSVFNYIYKNATPVTGLEGL